MNKIQIECFLSAAHTGSISSSANELFLSPQVVSQHIQNLEKDLGIILLQRTRHGVSLTEQGQQFHAYAVRLQGMYDTTLRKIEDHYASISATFHIGISEYVDPMGAIAGGLRAFKDQHQAVSMTGSHYVNRYLLEKMKDGSLDVAIINELQIVAGDDIDYQPIALEDLRLYISLDPVEQFTTIAEKNSEDHPTTTGNKAYRTFPSVEELHRYLKDLPHISASYGVWDTSDWEEVSHRMSLSLGYDFSRHYEAVNFRSCVLNLRTIPCSIVCDARFGYLPPENEFYSIPIKAESRLCALWNRKNENPLIQDFVTFMKGYYAAPVSS